MAWGDKCETKVRVLAVAKILSEGRRISAREIVRRLELQYGIEADRKTIYADMLAIDRFMPIDFKKGRNGGYQKYNVMDGLDDG